MNIKVLSDRIEFRNKAGQDKPEVYRLSGIGPLGKFTVEQQIMIETKVTKTQYCNLNRGIYAVFAFPSYFIVLLPERVRLTVAAAKELLGKPLPPERVLDDEIARAVSDLITDGARWDSAVAMVGVSSNGRHNKAPSKSQPGGNT